MSDEDLFLTPGTIYNSARRKEMTPEEGLRKIWEKRGLCWHEILVETIEAEETYYQSLWCSKCKMGIYDTRYTPNPDPSDPRVWMEVWEWGKGEKWWDEFITQPDKDIGVSSIAFEVEWVGDKEEYIRTDLIGKPAFFVEVAEFLEKED